MGGEKYVSKTFQLNATKSNARYCKTEVWCNGRHNAICVGLSIFDTIKQVHVYDYTADLMVKSQNINVVTCWWYSEEKIEAPTYWPIVDVIRIDCFDLTL